MVILALVSSDRQSQRIRAAYGHPHVVLVASTVSQAAAVLAEQQVDVLVIDPRVGSVVPRVAANAEELFDFANRYPYTPVVFYVSDPSKALRIIARFPTRERSDAVVAGLDDGPEEIARVIESAFSSTLVGELFKRLAPSLSGAPDGLIRAVRELFSNPRVFRTVNDLAAAACMSRRSLDRWLARSRIVAGAELLQIAKGFAALRSHRDAAVKRAQGGVAALTTSHGVDESSIDHVVGMWQLEGAAQGNASLTDLLHARLYRLVERGHTDTGIVGAPDR